MSFSSQFVQHLSYMGTSNHLYLYQLLKTPVHPMDSLRSMHLMTVPFYSSLGTLFQWCWAYIIKSKYILALRSFEVFIFTVVPRFCLYTSYKIIPNLLLSPMITNYKVQSCPPDPYTHTQHGIIVVLLFNNNLKVPCS